MDFSPGWLVASLCVSSIGTGFFIYGKKQMRLPQFLAGVLLILEAAFVPSVPWMFALAAAILACLWGLVRAGL